MNKIYCTYFDSNYFLQGLAMIKSLLHYDQKSEILVLALDDQTEILLQRFKLNRVTVVNSKNIEKCYPELLIAKLNRNKIEYYFTLTPAVIKYALSNLKHENYTAVYVDADLFFFDSPEDIFVTFSDYSVAIIPHNYSKKMERKLEKFGKYNVGMVIFKSDSEGTKVLEWWYQSCLEWCFDYALNGKFADQKYLENFSNISDRVQVIKHLGANLAPWNIDNYEISKSHNSILVNNHKLIFFHFHNLKIFKKLFLLPHIYFRAPVKVNVKEYIYRQYIQELTKLSSDYDIGFSLGFFIFNRKQPFHKQLIKILSIIIILIKRDYILLDRKYQDVP